MSQTITYRCLLQSVYKSSTDTKYSIQMNLENTALGLAKVAYVEVTVPDGETFAVSNELVERCWRDGVVLPGDVSGTVEVADPAPSPA